MVEPEFFYERVDQERGLVRKVRQKVATAEFLSDYMTIGYSKAGWGWGIET
jgi:hypothetical protein